MRPRGAYPSSRDQTLVLVFGDDCEAKGQRLLALMVVDDEVRRRERAEAQCEDRSDSRVPVTP